MRTEGDFDQVCGERSPDGQRLCIRYRGHQDPHGWEEQRIYVTEVGWHYGNEWTGPEDEEQA